jgi:hypothetical protein
MATPARAQQQRWVVDAEDELNRHCMYSKSSTEKSSSSKSSA